MHGVVNIALGEDKCRVRVGDIPQNVTVLRHIALNLLPQETAATCDIKATRLKAGWREDDLLQACGNASFHRQPWYIRSVGASSLLTSSDRGREAWPAPSQHERLNSMSGAVLRRIRSPTVLLL